MRIVTSEGAVAKLKMIRAHLCAVKRFAAAQKAPSHAQAWEGGVDSDRDSHLGNEAAQDLPISATELQVDQGVSSDQVLQNPITGRPSNTWSGNPWLRI
jgi:hypothetical protein